MRMTKAFFRAIFEFVCSNSCRLLLYDAPSPLSPSSSLCTERNETPVNRSSVAAAAVAAAVPAVAAAVTDAATVKKASL